MSHRDETARRYVCTLPPGIHMTPRLWEAIIAACQQQDAETDEPEPLRLETVNTILREQGYVDG